MKKGKILVVDDSNTIRRTAELFLSQEGYQVFVATCGTEAMHLLNEGFDAILLDVIMPELSGFELCAVIKSNLSWRHMPVIMLTGADGIANREHGYLAGADDYLLKPFNKPRLIEAVGASIAKERIETPVAALHDLQRELIDAINSGDPDYDVIASAMQDEKDVPSRLAINAMRIDGRHAGTLAAIEKLLRYKDSGRDTSIEREAITSYWRGFVSKMMRKSAIQLSDRSLAGALRANYEALACGGFAANGRGEDSTLMLSRLADAGMPIQIFHDDFAAAELGLHENFRRSLIASMILERAADDAVREIDLRMLDHVKTNLPDFVKAYPFYASVLVAAKLEGVVEHAYPSLDDIDEVVANSLANIIPQEDVLTRILMAFASLAIESESQSLPRVATACRGIESAMRSIRTDAPPRKAVYILSHIAGQFRLWVSDGNDYRHESTINAAVMELMSALATRSQLPLLGGEVAAATASPAPVLFDKPTAE